MGAAFTEPDAGSDLAGATLTTAIREGDEYIINLTQRCSLQMEIEQTISFVLFKPIRITQTDMLDIA